MAEVVQQTTVTPDVVTPDVVGNAFVHQYYVILHQSPELVHRFYQDVSKLGRPDESGIMSTTSTMHAINEKILSLSYGEFRAQITSVDSQESYNGGVLVLVTGYLIGNDDLRKKFTQSFFLAPQDKGYFVLNDIFRYVDDANYQSGNLDLVNNIIVPANPEQDLPYTEENHVPQQTAPPTEEVCDDPSENGDVSIEEEAPMPEVVDEVPDEIPDDSPLVVDSEIVAESNTKIEGTPKKSYASIVKVMKENAAPFSSPAPPIFRSAPKIQEQVTTIVAPPPTSETLVPTSNVTENGHDSEAEGPSIYVKGLPSDTTHLLLENEFKRFGPIRVGGIQVRCQKGFSFGFVEFEVASAVQSAIEASPIMINGCRVVVEEKRSTARGNNRGRYFSGAGAGYRNDGGRGRGNFGGGKAYGRGEFSNRTEYGSRNGNRSGYSNRGGEGFPNRGGDGFPNRGGEGFPNCGGDGFPNRGGDGFRRSDKTGNNGSRSNRGGGFPLNAAAKTTAPRVSATA